MLEDKKEGITAIIMGTIIFVVYILFARQVNEDKQQEEFAIQTARAENQKASSIAAIQKLENKIRSCIGIYDAARYAGTDQCVVGKIVKSEESTEPRDEYTAPELTYAYFKFTPNTFYLISYDNWRIFFNSYIGDCVKVWGKIMVDNTGTPTMFIKETKYGGNIEKLPDDACRP